MSSWFNDLMSSDQLRGLGRCPVCHVQNDLKEVKVINEKMPEMLLIHHCPHCQSNVLFCLMTESWGIGTVGVVTDLQANEVGSYFLTNGRGLNENTLLDYYQLMHLNQHSVVDKILADNI